MIEKDKGRLEVLARIEEFEKTNCNFTKFHNVDEVKEAIRQENLSGYYILIKGSNGIKLFQLPELL